jgi:hypothetical protein
MEIISEESGEPKLIRRRGTSPDGETDGTLNEKLKSIKVEQQRTDLNEISDSGGSS